MSVHCAHCAQQKKAKKKKKETKLTYKQFSMLEIAPVIDRYVSTLKYEEVHIAHNVSRSKDRR